MCLQETGLLFVHDLLSFRFAEGTRPTIFVLYTQMIYYFVLLFWCKEDTFSTSEKNLFWLASICEPVGGNTMMNYLSIKSLRLKDASKSVYLNEFEYHYSSSTSLWDT